MLIVAPVLIFPMGDGWGVGAGVGAGVGVGVRVGLGQDRFVQGGLSSSGSLGGSGVGLGVGQPIVKPAEFEHGQGLGVGHPCVPVAQGRESEGGVQGEPEPRTYKQGSGAGDGAGVGQPKFVPLQGGSEGLGVSGLLVESGRVEGFGEGVGSGPISLLVRVLNKRGNRVGKGVEDGLELISAWGLARFKEGGVKLSRGRDKLKKASREEIKRKSSWNIIWL